MWYCNCVMFKLWETYKPALYWSPASLGFRIHVCECTIGCNRLISLPFLYNISVMQHGLEIEMNFKDSQVPNLWKAEMQASELLSLPLWDFWRYNPI